MRIFFALIWIAAIQSSINAQQSLTIDEALTTPKFNPQTLRGIQWIPGTNTVTYTSAKGEAVLSQTLTSAQVDTLFKASALLAGLKRIPSITWMDKSRLHFENEGKIHFYRHGEAGKIYKSTSVKDVEETVVHPVSEAIAYVKNDNLYVNLNNTEKQITQDGGKGIVNGKTVHRSEFGITNGIFFSPTGMKIAFYRMDETMVTEYPLVELDTKPAHERMIRYPMAGQKSHHVSVGVYDIASGKTIFLQSAGPDEHYLTNIAWSPDEKFILIAEINRDQNKMDLNSYLVNDGSFVKTLFTEEDPQWVEPEHPAMFIPGTKDQFIWQSERNGFNHMYVYNLEGKLARHLDIGKEVITDIVGIDAQGKTVYAMATGNHGLDRHALSVNLKGKSTQLTQESGTHTIYWNSDYSAYVDYFTSLTVPGRVTLHDASGKRLRIMDESVDPIAKEPLPKPELVSLKAADGSILNGRLFPPLFPEKGKIYPVVIYVYGGPHAQMVTNSWLGGGNLWMSWMASQGYAVFTLDNRGSSERGIEFEQAIHRRLGDIEMQDQLVGVDYLKSLPWVDKGRIGVHGWSFGGFMTTTMLAKNPGLFQAGVAGGPVIDWSLYEVMYTERYMDTPEQNPDGYKNSNLTNVAPQLKDRLMLIHGTVDNVVVWQHSQDMVKACVDSGVLIDYMIYPGHEHNVRGKDRLHLYKTISRYLMDNLKEVEY